MNHELESIKKLTPQPSQLSCQRFLGAKGSRSTFLRSPILKTLSFICFPSKTLSNFSYSPSWGKVMKLRQDESLLCSNSFFFFFLSLSNMISSFSGFLLLFLLPFPFVNVIEEGGRSNGAGNARREVEDGEDEGRSDSNGSRDEGELKIRVEEWGDDEVTEGEEDGWDNWIVKEGEEEANEDGAAAFFFDFLKSIFLDGRIFCSSKICCAICSSPYNKNQKNIEKSLEHLPIWCLLEFCDPWSEARTLLEAAHLNSQTSFWSEEGEMQLPEELIHLSLQN